MPLAIAPMAGLTHSACRRLLGELGGCDTLYTEMLAGTAVRVEKPQASPFTRRRPDDGRTVYQLLLRDTKRLDEVIAKLLPCAPDGLDLNCGCPAAKIRQIGGGSDLFEDPPRLETILTELRRLWPGRLSVKLRLGAAATDGWRDRFAERLRMIAGCGVDAVTVNPRFAGDRLTRPARHDLLPWICSLTPLPVTANGDITGPETVARHPDWFAGCAGGVMLGRIAITRPWIFAQWKGSPTPDANAMRGLWHRMAGYIQEDFVPEQALGRIKLFTGWYSRNYRFGHTFSCSVRSAPDLASALDRANRFLDSAPDVATDPNLTDI